MKTKKDEKSVIVLEVHKKLAEELKFVIAEVDNAQKAQDTASPVINKLLLDNANLVEEFYKDRGQAVPDHFIKSLRDYEGRKSRGEDLDLSRLQFETLKDFIFSDKAKGLTSSDGATIKDLFDDGIRSSQYVAIANQSFAQLQMSCATSGLDLPTRADLNKMSSQDISATLAKSDPTGTTISAILQNFELEKQVAAEKVEQHKGDLELSIERWKLTLENQENIKKVLIEDLNPKIQGIETSIKEIQAKVLREQEQLQRIETSIKEIQDRVLQKQKQLQSNIKNINKEIQEETAKKQSKANGFAGFLKRVFRSDRVEKDKTNQINLLETRSKALSAEFTRNQEEAVKQINILEKDKASLTSQIQYTEQIKTLEQEKAGLTSQIQSVETQILKTKQALDQDMKSLKLIDRDLRKTEYMRDRFDSLSQEEKINYSLKLLESGRAAEAQEFIAKTQETLKVGDPNSQLLKRMSSLSSNALSRSSSSIDLDDRSSVSSSSSLSSSSSNSSLSSYGSRKSAKQGGANSSADKDAGVYQGPNGTYLIKSDDKEPQKDIAEYLISKVYSALAPESGAQIDLVKNEDGKTFLASKFIDGYEDFHKVLGHDKRDKLEATKELARSGFDATNEVKTELLKALPGGEYTGYAEAMIPSIIAGDMARHSGNFGIVNGEKVACIDFGAGSRVKHFGPEIDLNQHLPDAGGMGEKNYFKRDHPTELLETQDFAKTAERMSQVDISTTLRVAWLDIQANFEGENIKKFGAHIGVPAKDLDSPDFQDKIRDHYINTIRARQESLGRQYGTQALEQKLTPEVKKQRKKEEHERSAKTEIKKLVKLELKVPYKEITQDSKSVAGVCAINGGMVKEEDLKKVDSVLQAMMKEREVKPRDQYLQLMKLRNRMYVQYIKNNQDKFPVTVPGSLYGTQDNPKLVAILKEIKTIPGDLGDTEIAYVKQQFSKINGMDKLIDTNITKNKDLKLPEKDRLTAEGVYKLYSDGYSRISPKSEGATPGFMCKTPEGSMCIVKTGPKGEREELESIGELFACNVGKAVLKPLGLDKGIPDVELLNLSQKNQEFAQNKGYVRSVFFKDFKELYNAMGLEERDKNPITAPGKATEFIGKLKEENPQQFKDFCRYLAFRHVVRDLDGHSANFGTSKGEMVVIDLGLAGKGIASHPITAGDLTDKRLVDNVLLKQEASPNHLSDWGAVYKDQEFINATQELKAVFQNYPNEVKTSMKQSLESAKTNFSDKSLQDYCKKWLGLKNDASVNMDAAVQEVFDIHKERASKLHEIAQGISKVQDGDEKKKPEVKSKKRDSISSDRSEVSETKSRPSSFSSKVSMGSRRSSISEIVAGGPSDSKKVTVKKPKQIVKKEGTKAEIAEQQKAAQSGPAIGK